MTLAERITENSESILARVKAIGSPGISHEEMFEITKSIVQFNSDLLDYMSIIESVSNEKDKEIDRLLALLDEK